MPEIKLKPCPFCGGDQITQMYGEGYRSTKPKQSPHGISGRRKIMDETKEFRFRLLYARELRKMTQEQLSKKAGIPNTSICKFESGERKPSLDNLKMLAVALEISADYLLGFTTNEDFAAYIPLGTFEHLASQLSMEDIDLSKKIMVLMIERSCAMTKQEAKELSLEVWRYLAKHPEIENKANLPEKIHLKIHRMEEKCPLCKLYKNNNTYLICSKCPLGTCGERSLYHEWRFAESDNQRQKAAQKIVAAIEAWEPGEEK